MERSPSMSPPEVWTAERGRLLLKIARESVAEALGQGSAGRYDEPWLREPGASFVTLRRGEALRGCIGSVEAHQALGEDVRSNARASAFRDPRFPPVGPEELAGISFEVSVLSPPEPLLVSSEEEALRRLRPGIDGVIFEYHGHRGTFLPQVWEQLPDPKDFLAHLKAKAGLRPDFWAPEVRLQRYGVTKWEEGE